jgi:hypothetical protein
LRKRTGPTQPTVNLLNPSTRPTVTSSIIIGQIITTVARRPAQLLPLPVHLGTPASATAPLLSSPRLHVRLPLISARVCHCHSAPPRDTSVVRTRSPRPRQTVSPHDRSGDSHKSLHFSSGSLHRPPAAPPPRPRQCSLAPESAPPRHAGRRHPATPPRQETTAHPLASSLQPSSASPVHATLRLSPKWPPAAATR